MSTKSTLVLIALCLPLLAGCSPVVALEPAKGANDPGCAEIIVRLPDEISGLKSRGVNAQSTAAWGEPVAVILRCGLEAVTVSTLPCVSAGKIDWLVDDSAAPNYRFISFARSPATEVIIDSTKVAGVSVLESLEGSVGVIKPTANCTEVTN